MFSPDDVDRTARLARLELTLEESRLIAQQLAGILEYAERLQAVDTTGVSAAAWAHAAPLRDDVTRPSTDRDTLLASAPDADREAGFFKVPRVLR